MASNDHQLLNGKEKSTFIASKLTRTFSWSRCFTGLILLCLVFKSLVSSLLHSMPVEQEELSALLHAAADAITKKYDKEEIAFFEILCTTDRMRKTAGSFIIRCQDFKAVAEHCAENVRVHLYTHNQLIFKPNSTNHPDSWQKNFSATISVKIGLAPKPRFGKMFLDVVDRYADFSGLDPRVQVIVQTKYHAWDKFPNHTYHIVEHWYNSFPADMLTSQNIPKFDLPAIEANDSNNNNFKMATVWTNPNQPCPTISSTVYNNSNVTYDCINRRYTIGKWYRNYFNTSESEMQRIGNLLQDPKQGPGRVYYEFFWKYDMLIIPAKTASPEKLRYGNVQRAVSQFRSGVPVLLEIYGEVLEDFMKTYNYTCAYKMKHKTSKKAAKMAIGTQNPSSRTYWTLEEAVMAMKNSPELRRKCRGEGFAIAKDYSPARLVERELRILGYKGDFDCT